MKKTSSDYIYVGIQFILFVVYMTPITEITFATGSVLDLIGITLLTLGISIGLLSVI